MDLQMRLRNKHISDYSFLVLFTSLILLTMIAINSEHIVYWASGLSSERGLTGLMDSPAMRANQKYLNSMTWYGTLVSFSITIICLVGLGQVTLMVFCTIVYFSNTHYWDSVDALKQGSGGGGNMGMGMGMGKGGQGQMGGMTGSFGIDTLIDSFNKNMINIKRYSDCSTEFRANMNISEQSTLMEWGLQKGPILLITLLVLNMGWRGVLGQIFSHTIDAGTVFFESLPYDRIVKWAEFQAAQETGYQFTLGISGTDEGKSKEMLARQIFIKVQSVARLTKAEDIRELGSKCEGFVVDTSSKFKTPQYLATNNNAVDSQASVPIQNEMWKNISYSVRISNTDKPQDVNQGVYVKLSEFAKHNQNTSMTQKEYEAAYIVVAFRFKDRPDEGIFTPKYLPKNAQDGMKQGSATPLQQ